jgi:hypothetical protein
VLLEQGKAETANFSILETWVVYDSRKMTMQLINSVRQVKKAK